MRRILILGAGTAGTIIANRLRRRFAADVRTGATTITVVDQDDVHLYQPGLLFLPFGLYDRDQLTRPRSRQLGPGIRWAPGRVERVDAAARTVQLADGSAIPYDVLVIATGTRTVPEETEGLTGPGWRTSAFEFYTLDGAAALAGALRRFDGGRLVVNVVDMPIKCPVAPLEFSFLADWYFTRRGVRDRVQLTYVTPLDAAFTRPAAAATLGGLLERKRIELVTDFNVGRVDGDRRVLVSWDEREVPYDLLVVIPLHVGAEFVRRTPGLGDDLGFVRTDPATLQARLSPAIFAIGDATDVPTSKAGAVAHFEAEVVEENVARALAGEAPLPAFDGHANCFVETGHHKALDLDFNYDVEPLPGKYPVPGVGPLSLLRETRLNHAGKLAFRWVYWHLLLRGLDVPGVGTRLSMRGKRRPPSAPTRPPTPTAAVGSGSST